MRSVWRAISQLFRLPALRQREMSSLDLSDDAPSVEVIARTLLTDSSTDVRVRVLTRMLLDLFVEVEALRTAVSGAGGPAVHGIDPSLLAGKSSYQTAYLNTVYLSHNAAGPSSGLEKVLVRFYPSSGQVAPDTLRESSVLRRIGYSEDEVARYIDAARKAETFT
jgi:hypothetical protein